MKTNDEPCCKTARCEHTRPTPKHSPEPWEWYGNALMQKEGCGTILEAKDDERPYGLHSAILAMDNEEADKARIVACVNALAGVEDPASVRELVEAAKESAESWTALTDRLFDAIRKFDPTWTGR